MTFKLTLTVDEPVLALTKSYLDQKSPTAHAPWHVKEPTATIANNIRYTMHIISHLIASVLLYFDSERHR